MFKGFNNACDWSFSFPCHHLLILSRCFMAILRIWRTDRGKTLPISFVWDCEWIPYTDGGQPQLRAAPGYIASNLQKEKRRGDIIFSHSTACNVSVVSKLRQQGCTEGKGRKGETRQVTGKYLLVWGVTKRLGRNKKGWSERWFLNKRASSKDFLT